MTASPAALQAVFAALADSTRRELLERLAADGSGTTTGLAGAGLVAERRAEKERRYSVAPEPIEDAAAWMGAVGARWDRRLAALERYLTGPDEGHDGRPRSRGATRTTLEGARRRHGRGRPRRLNQS